jgi:hypothetical protein
MTTTTRARTMLQTASALTVQARACTQEALAQAREAAGQDCVVPEFATVAVDQAQAALHNLHEAQARVDAARDFMAAATLPCASEEVLSLAARRTGAGARLPGAQPAERTVTP